MKLLMCAPDYYDSPHEINPWTNIRRNVNRALAQTQGQLLYKLLTDQLGVELELIEPVKGLPNMVFTANAGLVRGSTFICSNFRQRERQPESAFFEAWFSDRRYEVVKLPKVYFFEGEGDACLMADLLVCGYQIPSDTQAHTLVSQILKAKHLSLRIADDRFYRLDTCFLPINHSTALYCRNAFDAETLTPLHAALTHSIIVRLDEALHHVCNSIVVGKNLVMPAAGKRTHDMLRLLGFRVHDVDLSEFSKAAGGIKSLAMTLERG